MRKLQISTFGELLICVCSRKQPPLERKNVCCCFVFSAALTVLSLILFTLVEAMNVAMLVDWMLFAAALDALFVVLALLFASTLQTCDLLLASHERSASQTIVVPDTILVVDDADDELFTHENEDADRPPQKQQRSKSLLYTQLAVDDFLYARR